MIDCSLLPDIERAEKRGLKRGEKLGANKKAIEIAQYFIDKGWEAKEIIEATKLWNIVKSMYAESSEAGRRYVQFTSSDIEQAEKRGLKRGIKQGAKKKAIEVAQYFINKEWKVEDIMEVTKLNWNTVKSLYAASSEAGRRYIEFISGLFAFDQAKKRGEKRGMKIGLERAMKRAEARGEKLGAMERTIEIAQYFIKDGWEAAKIAEATKLDLDTVQSLFAERVQR
jgi:predicted transposase YdaD